MKVPLSPIYFVWLTGEVENDGTWFGVRYAVLEYSDIKKREVTLALSMYELEVVHPLRGL